MVKIFIGNLSQDTTAEELRSLFSQYGKISECDIVKNFGFVHMDDKAEAEEAIRNLHHYELNGLAMNVELSRSKSKASTKLHVGNISSSCTNQELRAKFEEYGPVVECDIVKDYAFVHMERVEDAMEAISGLDNTAFQGKLMSVKLSTSRLRTAPGMGERTGCYRCGQEGHWSKECPLDQNGSYGEGPMGPGANGFGPPRFGGGGSRGRGFPRGFSGDPSFASGYAPVHAFGRGPATARPGTAGRGIRGAVSYGVPPGYGMGAEHSMARAYGADGASGPRRRRRRELRRGTSLPGAAGGLTTSGTRDGVVDFYEKYRARPTAPVISTIGAPSLCLPASSRHLGDHEGASVVERPRPLRASPPPSSAGPRHCVLPTGPKPHPANPARGRELLVRALASVPGLVSFEEHHVRHVAGQGPLR
ncbi:hypothetical protein ANANG_G00070900 [Anguilla anguilla]|uniref:RNA-binding protein 4.1-like n=1 Tax=Anguilla anguilla TaxID=7936 RepID=A0A9D3MQM9_ANGAN|nr:hypothetical protein ANANG_G00070900 [Anguilla anguilla]